MPGAVETGARQGMVLWVVLAALVVAEHLLIGTAAPPWWQSLAGIAAVAVAVTIGRSRPLLSLAVAISLVAAQLLVSLVEEPPFLVSYVVALSVVRMRLRNGLASTLTHAAPD